MAKLFSVFLFGLVFWVSARAHPNVQVEIEGREYVGSSAPQDCCLLQSDGRAVCYFKTRKEEIFCNAGKIKEVKDAIKESPALGSEDGEEAGKWSWVWNWGRPLVKPQALLEGGNVGVGVGVEDDEHGEEDDGLGLGPFTIKTAYGSVTMDTAHTPCRCKRKCQEEPVGVKGKDNVGACLSNSQISSEPSSSPSSDADETDKDDGRAFAKRELERDYDLHDRDCDKAKGTCADSAEAEGEGVDVDKM